MDGDALGVARELLGDAQASRTPGAPPFLGGIAGYIGYDYGSVLERIPAPRYDDLALFDVVLGLYDWVIAWDHQQRTASLVSLGLPACGSERDQRARERGTMVKGRLSGKTSSAPPARSRAAAADRAPSYPVTSTEAAIAIGLRSTFTHRGYLDAVARVREYIVAGDIFQANLSQRFQAPLREAAVRAVPPASAARTPRPSPPISASTTSRCSACPPSASFGSTATGRWRPGRSREPGRAG